MTASALERAHTREQPAPPTEAKRDWDVMSALCRYWLGELTAGEAAILGRLIDQIYLYTKGGTERALTSRFLIEGTLGGVQVIPCLPFARAQWKTHLSKLKARGLVSVHRPFIGATFPIYRLHIDQILACCDAPPSGPSGHDPVRTARPCP